MTVMTNEVLVTEDLLDRLSRDLDGTFPELVRTHQDGIYSGVRRLVGDSDAEDVTQEAFVRAYRALRGYDAVRIRTLSLRGWLWTIALNRCRNRARARGRRPREVPVTDRDAIEPAGTEATALEAVATEALARRLESLPSRQRRAVVLRHVAGLTYPEIAVATGTPEGTVKSDVYRGLAALRASYEEEERR